MRPEDLVQKYVRDPELRRLVARGAKAVCLGLEKGILHHSDRERYPVSRRIRTLERTFATRMAKFNPELRRKLIDKAKQSSELPHRDREKIYGDLANLDFRTTGSIIDEVRANPLPAMMRRDVEAVASRFRPSSEEPTGPQPVTIGVTRQVAAGVTDLGGGSGGGIVPDRIPVPRPNVTSVPQSPNRSLELVISRLLCHEDTKEGLILGIGGRDEIYLGGLAHDLCSLTTRILSPVFLGEFKADSKRDRKQFTPPLSFAKFRLHGQPIVPYLVTLVLTEAEGAPRGLEKHLSDLHAVTQGDLIEESLALGLGLIAKDLLVSGKDNLGLPPVLTGLTALSPILIPIVLALSAIVIGFLTVLAQGVANLFKDEIFPEVAVAQTAGRADFPIRLPGGVASTGDRPEFFTGPKPGFGGRYELTYEWRLV